MLRKARISDIKAVHRLINDCAAKGEMLSRSLAELYDNMRDYFVYEEQGEVAGACALHICWEDLAEIRSLCVIPEFREQGHRTRPGQSVPGRGPGISRGTGLSSYVPGGILRQVRFPAGRQDPTASKDMDGLRQVRQVSYV